MATLSTGGPISTPGAISFTAYAPKTGNATPSAGQPTAGGGFNAANPFGGPAGADPYNALRNQATEQAGNDQAQGLDAIQRRFAAMGQLNSGANIKAQEELNRQSTDAKQNAIGNINVAEQQQALPYAQLQQQGQEFGSSQDLAQQQLGEQSNEFGANLQLGQNQQDLDTAANNINASLGAFQANHSGGLFGGGGILGFGIGDSAQNSGFGSFSF